MSSHSGAARPKPDRVITDIADYVDRYRVRSALAVETAHYCLVDSLGCGFEAMAYPDCTKLLGPIVPGTVVPHGARVPATPYQLDPVTAAFNIGALIRWLDYNDAFNGETVVHPSDCFGGILAAADWASRTRVAAGKPPILMAEVLDTVIKAYEIAGGLGTENAFTKRMGLDPVALNRKWNKAPRDHQIAGLAAITQINVKYVEGREDAYVQMDCSGLQWYSWRVAGLDMPRQAVSQQDRHMRIERKDALWGDIVGEGTHVHMYLGLGNAMIHAPFNGKRVKLKMMSEAQALRSVWADPSLIAQYRL